MNGDIKGAIAYMREHEEFKDVLPAYVAIFENREYRTFEVPDALNDILRLYQVYFRDTFYCRAYPEADAAEKLLDAAENAFGYAERGGRNASDGAAFNLCLKQNGYHSLFGKTQGYYGPYIWRDTVPTVYRRRIARRKGRIYGQHSQRLRRSRLDGLSHFRQIRHGTAGLPPTAR